MAYHMSCITLINKGFNMENPCLPAQKHIKMKWDCVHFILLLSYILQLSCVTDNKNDICADVEIVVAPGHLVPSRILTCQWDLGDDSCFLSQSSRYGIFFRNNHNPIKNHLQILLSCFTTFCFSAMILISIMITKSYCFFFKAI
jgi:hypothetical protein